MPKLNKRGQMMTAGWLAVIVFSLLFLGLYVLAIAVLAKLFMVSIWWGFAGLTAYLFKPRLNFKWS